MKIAVIGVGYVGLCSGVGLAVKGHDIIGTTTTPVKAEMINGGKSPIYEEGLEEALNQCIANNKFQATTDIESAVRSSSVVFICVGTPSSETGEIDLSQIRSSAEEIGKIIKDISDYKVIVVKSTVVPGTTEDVVLPLIQKHSGKHVGKDFGLAMNPEFLREGKAMHDFLNPDRIVIGGYDQKSISETRKVYQNFSIPILETNIKTAEMIKYASNAFLATKISFINELGNLCKKIGIDTYDVAKGMGLDSRIGPHFLQAGIGYGGSCFPKDTKALIAKANQSNSTLSILENVEEVNNNQRFIILDILKKKLLIKEKTIAVLGLAFKAGTDDMRESPVIDIIKSLQKEGAKVKAYDPQSAKNAQKILPGIEFCSNVRDTLRNANACLILTDWPEFSELSDEDFSLMSNKIIIEGRKTLNPQKVSGYEGVCW